MRVKGSNQFKARHSQPWKANLIGFFIFTILLVIFAAVVRKDAVEKTFAQEPLISPVGSPIEYKVPSLDPDLTERENNIALIKKIWGKDQVIGLEISRCESGYRTHAKNLNTNGTTDQGLFQVNTVHGMPEMDSAVANIEYGYLLFKQQGTSPWNSSAKCWK